MFEYNAPPFTTCPPLLYEKIRMDPGVGECPVLRNGFVLQVVRSLIRQRILTGKILIVYLRINGPKLNTEVFPITRVYVGAISKVSILEC